MSTRRYSFPNIQGRIHNRKRSGQIKAIPRAGERPQRPCSPKGLPLQMLEDLDPQRQEYVIAWRCGSLIEYIRNVTLKPSYHNIDEHILFCSYLRMFDLEKLLSNFLGREFFTDSATCDRWLRKAPGIADKLECLIKDRAHELVAEIPSCPSKKQNFPGPTCG